MNSAPTKNCESSPVSKFIPSPFSYHVGRKPPPQETYWIFCGKREIRLERSAEASPFSFSTFNKGSPRVTEEEARWQESSEILYKKINVELYAHTNRRFC